jgi:hypothetical protein
MRYDRSMRARQPVGRPPFHPRQIPGLRVWYDPSDYSSLFQDSAGTIPVTGVEQQVGLMLDKSKGLVLGAELVTNGDFSSGATGWVDASTAPSTFAVLASQAVLTADGTNRARMRQTVATVSGRTYVVTAYASSAFDVSASGVSAAGIDIFAATPSGSFSRIFVATSSTTFFQFSRLNSGTVALDNISVRELPGNHATQATSTSRPILRARYNLLLGTETLATQSVTTAATTQRLRFAGAGSVTLSGTATGTYTAGTHTFSTTAGTLTLTVSGVVTQADLRTANDALGMPDYQRVTTATDYDTVGFLPYLFCDGFDDGMSTAAIDFTNTDKVTVCAGVRKLSDAARGIVMEISPSTFSNNNAFYLIAPETNGAATYGVISRGGAESGFVSTGYTAPNSAVISAKLDHSKSARADRVAAKVNLSNTSQNPSGAATDSPANFGNYPLFLFRRGGTSLPFNGRFKGLVIIGTLLPEGQLQQLEQWMNRKTGAF